MFLEKDSQIDGLISKLSRASVVAVDTETTGLVWKKD
jgi:hypothetical protein